MDRWRRSRRRRETLGAVERRPSPICHPLGDEGVIFRLALGRTIFAQVVIAAVDGDDGAVFGFVMAVFGDSDF
ncbi:MAG: hypothetical protein ACTHN5_24125 [Phycisphaerae bacterium]